MRAARARPAAISLCGALAALLAAACAERQAPPAAAAPLVVVDDLGRRVALRGPAQRIASLSPANSEILYAVGCGARIVLRDRASGYPAALRAVPATDAFQLAPDHIAGFRPDLVLLSHADAARLAALERLGVSAASFDPTTLDAVLATIRTVGALCGAEPRAARLVGELRRRLQAARQRVPGGARPRVYAELDGADPARPWTAGRGSFVDQLISLAGGANVAAALPRPYAQISAELLLRSDPQVILLAVAGGGQGQLARRLRQRPGWQGLAAVRAGRIIDTIDPDLLSRPGPRLVSGLEQLVAALHAAPAPERLHGRGERP